MNPGWRVQQPYCVALAPQSGDHEAIWYIGCRVCEGTDKLFMTQNHFDYTYPDLARWVKTIPNAPAAVYITFGPKTSYFACAPGLGSIWSGIATDLRDKVHKAFDTPCQVALGVKDAWFVMWPDGYFAWKFYGGYGNLDKILDAAEPRSVAYLALSPYSKDQYFVAFKDRTVKYSLSPEWMPQMQEVFLEWQTEIMRASGMTPYHQPPQNYPPGQYPPQQNPQMAHRQSIYGAPPPNQGYPPTPQQSPGYFPAVPELPATPYQYPHGPQTPQTPYATPYQQSPQMANGQMVAPLPGALAPQTSRDKKDAMSIRSGRSGRSSLSSSLGLKRASLAFSSSKSAVNVGSQTCVMM
ncbi:hypothetical protein BU16DRAFT_24779 [Lophium mytilinum]|uniref:Uncharacterized protein n=1 Tax=Lophium mytilinum TaxID=390894 RepID=A0A6A6RDM3_9PEZI|nr:hypothetical protein BU16DRAFT_24779 [Lophium mytilinum]